MKSDGGNEIVIVTFKKLKNGMTYYSPLAQRAFIPGESSEFEVARILDWSMPGPVVASVVAKSIEPDLVHVQSSSFLYPPWLSSFPRHFGRGMSVLITTHDVPSYRQFHVYPFLHMAYARADRLMTLSKHVVEDLVRYHAVASKRILTVDHGVDTQRFNPGVSPRRFYEKYGLDDSKFNVMTFGFLSRGKGVEQLLRAFRSFRLKHPREAVRLIIAGAPRDNQSYLRTLDSVIKSLGIESDVFITGYIDDELIAPALAAADVLSYPYLGVSQSGPLHLSLAMGKPVIVSDARGFEEIISDGVNGLVVRAGDADSLANALERLYRNEEERARLGRNARAYAEAKLDWGVVAAKIHSIYAEMAGKSGFPQ